MARNRDAHPRTDTSVCGQRLLEDAGSFFEFAPQDEAVLGEHTFDGAGATEMSLQRARLYVSRSPLPISTASQLPTAASFS